METRHNVDISFNISLERENQNQAANEVILAKVEALPVIESPYVSSYLICIIKSDKTGTQYPFYSIGFV